MGLIYRWCNYWDKKIKSNEYPELETYTLVDLMFYTLCLPVVLFLLGVIMLFQEINKIKNILKDYINSIKFEKDD